MCENTTIINTVDTTTSAAPLKVKFVEIDAATGESSVTFGGIDAPLVAANINALAVSVLAESYRQERPIELNDIGERVSVSESEHVIQTIRKFCGPDGFDFVGYFSSTEYWGGDPELSEILEDIAKFETPIWCQWRTGRLGYISIDREKATLLSIPPRKIARDELRATTTAARVAPRAFLYSVLRDLVSFGPESTWLENQANLQWGNLPGNPIKPGKLLRKIVPGMAESWYVTKAEELAARIKQKFSLCEQIQVSHDLETIYDMEGGFVSCMKGRGEYYRGLINAIPDLKIAFICDPDNSGRLLGRAILWPDVQLSNGDSIKLMDRIYSSSELVRQSFRRFAKINGYYHKVEDGHSCKYCSNEDGQINLSGAFVESSHTFCPGDWPDGAPYLDTFSETELGDNRIFCFANRCQISLRETNGEGGWLTDPPTCSICGAEITDTDAETWGDNIYCASCAEHLEECIHCAQYSHPHQGGIWTVDGFLCNLCEALATQCKHCDNWYYDVQMVDVETPEISGEICPSCLKKIEERYELQECSVNHCKTLILPDSPGHMCKYHRESLGKTCAHCGEWTPTDKATQIDVYWLCPDCIRLLVQGNPLSIGYYCTECKSFYRGKPAANCGHVVLCKECYTMGQAPEDYRPPRVIATPPPAELPETPLTETLKTWIHRVKEAATPDEKGNIIRQLGGRIHSDCNEDPERHRQVFDSLLYVLPIFFSKTRGYYDNSDNSTIIECSYMDGFHLSIHLYHNRGTQRTWIEARQLDL